MVVLVRYFAVLRERKGASEETVALRPGDTAGRLYARLFPDTGAGRLPVMFAVNHAYAKADQPLVDGDEVGFLPPLGGG